MAFLRLARKRESGGCQDIRGEGSIGFDIVVNKYYNCIQKGLQLWIYFVLPNLN